MKTKEETIAALIRRYQMQQHPEGGWYAETYRHSKAYDFPGFEGSRNISTSILFLLPEGQKSALHRIKSDEIWYYHAGGTLHIITLDENGMEQRHPLGSNIEKGDNFQYTVKAGTWFGAEPTEGSGYCLVGCSVSPGFDFRDFELM